jgi:glycosyltransferase involved in cell wall biosynthesis
VAELALEPEDEAACSFLADDAAAGPDAAREVRALLYSAGLRFRLASLLRDFGADFVYERYALLATAGSSAARALRIPHVLEVNAPLSDEQAAHRGLAFCHATRQVERATLRGADRVIAVSHGVADWAAKCGVEPMRLSVLSNGVDPARFSVSAAQRAAMRASLGVDGAPVIGFLGTLKPWHDLASLIRATAMLVRAGLRARLLVIGDGPERPRLEALARAENLDALTTFVGAVPHDDVPRYLSALDVAAVTYGTGQGYYFSPLKLFEYLAAARPVVAAAAGDIEHCIRDGVTGLLYPPGDVRVLADALLAVITEPARGRRLAQAGRDPVRAHHTWAANGERVVALAREQVQEAAWA